MQRRGWMIALTMTVALLLGMAAFNAQHRMTAAAGAGSPQAPEVAGLTAPVGAAVGKEGTLYIAESGANTGTPPRVLRWVPGRTRETLAADFPAPLTGITWRAGKLYVSYAGGVDVLDPATGLHHPVLTKLPALGDHPNGPVAFGPDEKIYFGVGTATNAGVVGEDNISRGWVKSAPQFHDIPCKPVTLRGSNFAAPNPLTPDPLDRSATGAFMPFGKTTGRLQNVPGSFPCTGAILRANPDGTNLELVAWGLRNPTGLAFTPDGKLYATVQGFRDWGSRPVVGDRDYLYRIDPGRWYGWPDYAGGRSVVEEEFQRAGKPALPLLAHVPEQPPTPAALFASSLDVGGLVFLSDRFGARGEALVALASPRQTLAPAAPPPPPPRASGAGPSIPPAKATTPGMIARVNLTSGLVTPFAVAHASPAQFDAVAIPAMQRPVALAAAPDGTVYVVDFGATRHSQQGVPEAVPGAGAIWRISPPGRSLGTDLRAVRWRWALVGMVLSLAGVRLLRAKCE